MNYTLAHLKIAHYIGGQNVSFEEVSETIALLERNGIIDAQGNWSFGNGQPRHAPRAKRSSTAPAPVRRKRRGSLSKKIVKFLQSKGAKGAHVKDIAAAVKSGSANVTAWFYNTGKSLIASGKIKKVAPATFAYAK
jgi:predicted transcriptional regulator with HTH domain